ncbi:RING-type domain-containing protein [Meloidogyne graminicola]|uniref:RING-type domain-containing protein n=1 Tax=Meloidogyne graminicola TaxID=189291 RepID=A0A8S9ZUY7_9BILA|nr:RING-type domain-containing protein [Meloidogyne graminicola]
MNEWFHCNKCFLSGENNENETFWFTSCGHIICTNCKKNGNLLIGQKGICVVCSKHETSVIMVNKNMRPDLVHLFQPPKDLVMEYAKKLKTAVEFQNAHRQRLFKHIREKYNKVSKFAKAAQIEFAKRVEREKNLLAERNQVKIELDGTKDYVRQLEKILADRDQEIHRLKRTKSPSSNKRTSPNMKGRMGGYPSLNGNTPISRVSFFGCTTSTPNEFPGIAAGCFDNRRTPLVASAGNAEGFDFLSRQGVMEDIVACGPSFIPNTPALLGLPASTRRSLHCTPNFF